MQFDQDPWANIDDTKFYEEELLVNKRCADVNYETLLGSKDTYLDQEERQYYTVSKEVLQSNRDGIINQGNENINYKTLLSLEEPYQESRDGP
jgi:hypothetical protein